MARIIVTHTHPDLDAIGAAWLLQSYGGLGDCHIKFVNTGDPDQTLLEHATAVVDTGGVYAPDMRRFDHHQDTRLPQSATMLVANWLRGAMTVDIDHLKPLIDLIHWGDTGDSRANQSREVGLHALLSSRAHQEHRDYGNGYTDLVAFEFGSSLFDLIDQSLKAKHEARELLQQHTVYRSEDGKFIAIKDAPGSVTQAAFEQGAEIVLFQSKHETPDGTSYAIGMQRNQAVSSPHLGQLVVRAMDYGHMTAIERLELMSWYLHPVGFFAGRGTRKAPVLTPITIDLASIALAFDGAWER